MKMSGASGAVDNIHRAGENSEVSVPLDRAPSNLVSLERHGRHDESSSHPLQLILLF